MAGHHTKKPKTPKKAYDDDDYYPNKVFNDDEYYPETPIHERGAVMSKIPKNKGCRLLSEDGRGLKVCTVEAVTDCTYVMFVSVTHFLPFFKLQAGYHC